jgi:hypothetical protein
MEIFKNGISWDIEEDDLKTIHDQLRVFLKDASLNYAESTDVRLFWVTLGDSQRVKYGKLARFAKRCLDTPGGSAEVERSVSIYNQIVTSDRTRLSDERIQEYVKIYANGNKERQEKNDKRARNNLVAQKKKAEDRIYQLDDNAFKPPKKISRTVPEWGFY